MKEHLTTYASTFKRFERSLNGEAYVPFHAIRRKAIARFGEIGFPTARHEEWRYTNITPITKTIFLPILVPSECSVTLADVERFALGAKTRLVFVNGRFDPTLSTRHATASGARIGSLSGALGAHDADAQQHLASLTPIEESAFTALNTAFAVDGAFIVVPDDVSVDDTVNLLFIATNASDALVTPRNLIVVGKNSRLTIVESYVGTTDGRYLTNAVSEVFVGENAVVEHDKFQNESTNAFHVASTHVKLSGRSNFISNSIALGGSIVRNNITCIMDAEHSECTLNGLSLGTDAQLIDNHTAIDHAKPHCVSHELYKSILDGNSRGVFNGKIFVRKDAQKTDAKQTNKTLLLSDDATIDTKPQLEIFADDVKCTHGATVGQLDPDQVFYLRSRGINETEARDMLTYAFAADVVARMHDDALRGQLETLVHAKLDEGRKRHHANR